MNKAEFVAVKDYIIEYGHNGKHVRIIRTRCDIDENTCIQFFLLELDITKPNIQIPRLILSDEVMKIFKKYNPNVSESYVEQFIRGLL